MGSAGLDGEVKGALLEWQQLAGHRACPFDKDAKRIACGHYVACLLHRGESTLRIAAVDRDNIYKPESLTHDGHLEQFFFGDEPHAMAGIEKERRGIEV